MAKKEDLKLDEFNYDDGLDLNWDDEVDGSINQEAFKSKKRTVVGDVVRGSLSGAKDTAMSASFIKDTLRKSLPQEYGDIAGGMGELTQGLYALQNDVTREIKPHIASIAEKIDGLVPEENTRTKKLMERIKRFAGVRSSGNYDSSENQDEQAVEAMLGIFEQNANADKAKEKKQIVRDAVEQKRFTVQGTLLQDIRDSTARTAQYTTNVTQAYQKKMLELTLRSYLGDQKHQGEMSRFMQGLTAQMEAVVKNTSLPEYAKITGSERFMDHGKKRFMDSMYGEGSPISRFMGRVRDKSMEAVEGFKWSLENVDMNIDNLVSGKETIDDMNQMLIEMGEKPLTKAEMLGATAGGMGMNFLRDKVAARLKKAAEKNKGLSNRLARGASMVLNPGATVNRFRQGDKWQDAINDYDSVKGKAARFLDVIAGMMGDEKNVPTISGTDSDDDLRQPTMGFDKRAHLTLVDVIPGHLASIRREIAMLRTGTDQELMTYDYNRRQWVTDKTAQSRAMKKITGAIKDTGIGFKTEQAARHILQGADASDKDQEGIKRVMYAAAKLDDTEITSEVIKNLPEYDMLSPKARAILNLRLEEMDSSGLSDVKRLHLNKQVRGIKDSMTNTSNTIDSIIQGGDGRYLEEGGIVSRREDGTYEINEDKLDELLEQEGVVGSDPRTKRIVAQMTPEELLAAARNKGGSWKLRAKAAMRYSSMMPFAGMTGEGLGANIGAAGRRMAERAGAGFQALRNRAKDGESFSPSSALEGIKKTKLYNFFYKDGMGDDAQHFGAMADDVQENMGDEAAPGGKVLDLQTMNGMSMAAIQKLSKDVGQVQKDTRLRGTPTLQLLSSMDASLKSINERVQEGMFGVGMPDMSGVGDKAKNLYQRAKGYAKTGSAWMVDHIRQGYGKVGRGLMDAVDYTKGLGESFVDRNMEPVDLYLAGSKRPAIRAKWINQGRYFDAKTGKPIMRFQEILKAKYGILDGKENYVVTPEEMAEGFFDKEGKPVRSFGVRVGAGLLQGASDLAAFGYEKLKSVGDFLGNRLTDAKGMVGTAWNALKEHFEKAVDLYLPGEGKPSIRVKNLVKGIYYDAEGSPLVTMEAILQAKDGIFDKAGNIVVSAEEMAQGLYDRHGKRVKTFVGNLVSGAVGLAGRLYQSGMKNIKRFGAALGNKFQDVRNAWNSQGGLNLGKLFNFGRDDQILVDIRDILLGNKEEVLKRIKAEDSNFKVSGSFFGALTSSLGALLGFGGSEGGDTQGEGQGGGLGGFGGSEGAFGMGALKGWNFKGASDRLRNSRLGQMVGRGRDRLTGGFGNSKIGSKIGGAFGRVRGSRLGSIAGGLLHGAKDMIGTGLGAAGSFLGLGGEEAGSDTEGSSNQASYYDDPKVPVLLKKRRPSADGKDRPIKANSTEDRAEKLEALQASRRHDVQADTSLRYRSATNAIDRLMNSAKGILNKLAGGIGELAEDAADLAQDGFDGRRGRTRGGRGRISKGVGRGAIKRGVGRGMARGAERLAVKGAGRAAVSTGARVLATQGLRTAAMAALPEAAAAVGSTGMLAGAGTALMTGLTALGSILASPIVIGAAAVAGAAYGGYKLYQYATRDDADEWQTIRLKQYGFYGSPEAKQFNHMAYQLESYLLDGKLTYSRGRNSVVVDYSKVKMEAILDIFGLTIDDTEQAVQFRQWLANRFLPFFLTHITSIGRLTSKYPNDFDALDKMEAKDKIRYLQLIRYEEGPYDYPTSPIKELTSLTTDKEGVLGLIDALSKKVSDKAGVTTDTPTQTPEQEQAAKLQAQKQADMVASYKQAGAQAVAQAKAEQARIQATQQLQQTLSAKNFQLVTAVKGENPQDAAAAFKNTEMESSKDMDNQTKSDVTDPQGGGATGSIPMAGGAPLSGDGGSQYLKLMPGVKLNGIHPRIQAHFLGMAEEYGKLTGKTIQVNDGFRTYQDQVALKAKYGPRAATPGKSLHESGLAIDINSADANELERLGLMKKYGFTRPVGGEPWHIEPAGIQKNFALARKDPNAADKMTLASLGRGGGGYGTVQGATKYRRNHELAMSLLNAAPSTPPDIKLPDGADQPAISATTDGSAVSASGMKGQAANSDTMEGQQQASATTGMQPMGPQTTALGQAQGQPQGQGGGAGGRGGGGGASGSWSMGQEFEIKPSDSSSATGETGVKAIITENAKRAGEDPALMQTMAAIESSMNPNAKASTSSASGLFQFIRSTWNAMLGKFGGKYGLSGDASPFDPAASTLMASEYVKQNKKAISSVKPNPSAVDVYLAHFLGAGGARTFLKADPNAIAAQILPAAARANKSIFYDKSGRARTIAETYAEIGRRVSTKAKSVGLNVTTSTMPSSKTGAGASQVAETGIGDAGGQTAATGVPGVAQEPGAMQTASTLPRSEGAIPRSMIPQAQGSGVMVDSSSSAGQAAMGQQAGQGLNTLAGLQSSMETSVTLQGKMLDVLESIKGNTDMEKLAKVLAEAIKASSSGADPANDKKAEDARRMGRTDQVQKQSLDMTRRAA